MAEWYVPYIGKKPASVTIKGHKLVILSQDRDAIEDELNSLGGDRIKTIKAGGSKVDQERVIGKIAEQVDGGVVIAPNDVELRDVIRKLEDELPWLH
jgi:hypothetical protein